MNPVLEYIMNLPFEQRIIAEWLHEMIISFDNIQFKISWGIPMYKGKKSNVCYIYPMKHGGIDLCFMKGVRLSKYFRELEVKDRKLVASMTFLPHKDYDEKIVLEILAKAVELAK